MRFRLPGLTALVTAALALAVSACSSSRTPTTPTSMTPMAEAPPAPAPAPPAPTPPSAPRTARYRVTFDSTWSAATHPQDWPADAHYSGLIGGTHASTVSFWQPGALATEGIRAMAERGSKSTLSGEVDQAIAQGRAQYVLSGDALGRSPGVVSLEFDITQEFPLATIVTMVAPSPDWFVGVSGLALFENGAWRDSVSVEVFAYDAGTDSGASYASPDQETRPRQPIARLTGFPFLNGSQVLPLGTFRFERLP